MLRVTEPVSGRAGFRNSTCSCKPQHLTHTPSPRHPQGELLPEAWEMLGPAATRLRRLREKTPSSPEEEQRIGWSSPSPLDNRRQATCVALHAPTPPPSIEEVRGQVQRPVGTLESRKRAGREGAKGTHLRHTSLPRHRMACRHISLGSGGPNPIRISCGSPGGGFIGP